MNKYLRTGTQGLWEDFFRPILCVSVLGWMVGWMFMAPVLFFLDWLETSSIGSLVLAIAWVAPLPILLWWDIAEKVK